MTSGDKNFNDFPANQLTKFHALQMSCLVLKRAMSTFLHVHAPIFLHTGIEYKHEKSASLEKCKKVDMARFSTRELK